MIPFDTAEQIKRWVATEKPGRCTVLLDYYRGLRAVRAGGSLDLELVAIPWRANLRRDLITGGI